jgi:glycosyltransferase involved in cell wall biosynthesis
VNDAELASVILPVYNGERFLAEAIDSVLAQTRPELELLAIDDGSTDASADILADFAARDPRVIVMTQANAGVTAARNAGIAGSRGNYIAFLDQDDRWTPDALALHLAALAANPGLGYTLAHQVCFLEPGAEEPEWFKLQQLDAPVAGYLPGALCARRDTFDRIGPFDERFTISSDADWFARARDAGIAMQLLPEATLQRRIHDVNQSRHAEVIQQELFQLLAESIRRKREQS